MPINITEEFVRNLMNQNAELLAQNAELLAQNTAVLKQLEQLNQTIKELQEQINKNSKNSSKPPSSDGLKKPTVNKDRSLRGKSGKKQGAQEGHSGTYLSVLSEPDDIIQHIWIDYVESAHTGNHQYCCTEPQYLYHRTTGQLHSSMAFLRSKCILLCIIQAIF